MLDYGDNAHAPHCPHDDSDAIAGTAVGESDTPTEQPAQPEREQPAEPEREQADQLPTPHVSAKMLRKCQKHVNQLRSTYARTQLAVASAEAELAHARHHAYVISENTIVSRLRAEMALCEEMSRSAARKLGTATPLPDARDARTARLREVVAQQKHERTIVESQQTLEALVGSKSLLLSLQAVRGDSDATNPHCTGGRIGSTYQEDDDFPVPGLPPSDEDDEPIQRIRVRTAGIDNTSSRVEHFFIGMARDELSKQYQSTAMRLTLRDDTGITQAMRAIVDSGAAWSAIDATALASAFPAANVTKSSRKFRDASDRLMPLLGSVRLQFYIGDLLLDTEVFVFKKLGAPFLLGVNALHQHGLTISNYRGIIYSEKPEATVDSQEPIQFSPVDTPVPAEHKCGKCLMAQVQGNQNPDETLCEQCTTHSGTDWALVCDADGCTLKAHSTTGRELNVGCEKVPHYATTDAEPDHSNYCASLSTRKRYVVPAGARGFEIRLRYSTYLHGPTQSLEIALTEPFKRQYCSTNLSFLDSQLHSSMNASVPLLVSNSNDYDVVIPADLHVADAAVHRPHSPQSAPHAATMLHVDEDPTSPFEGTDLVFRVLENRPASGRHWKLVGCEPPTTTVPCINGTSVMPHTLELQSEPLRALLDRSLEVTQEEWSGIALPATLRMLHYIRLSNGQCAMPSAELDFADGGRPTTKEHMQALGFDLSLAIDPGLPARADGTYPPLSAEKQQVLYDVALKWWRIWSRDARTPELSRLVVLEIPTGDAAPVAKKPYPLPYQYLEAVRTEVRKLLEGGLIEPCISNWAAPVLVRLKKDSGHTPDTIRLKLIIDFRSLNERTVPDVAGLGDQDEILDGFGGDQRYCGIVDAAGGFYQFLIKPSHRHKTAFVLPTSMGGTSFQWRVAPYGLTRNPSGYSRGMMFALKGLDHCVTRHGTAGCKSWIDDVSLHANTFEAFAETFERVLMRLSYACMSLKASKCFLLHQKLEVLGFYVTPDGLVMQEDKIKSFQCLDREGNIVGPKTLAEIRTFLGAVQFYRRFVPRLAFLAAPMNALLKKMPEKDPRGTPGTPEHTQAWNAVRQSYEAIMTFMTSRAIVSAPDLSDPHAEYVICTDACDVAAGGALLQWQWPGEGYGPGPPAGIPMRGQKGPDPLTQSWRIEAGWKLRTIAFYSKTFDKAQQNYATFDKESAAILLCCRKWAKLITCRPTTLYTDSVVAASMLYKHMGPPRLQRWGMELGTFLPYLKVSYRKGEQNGLADFLSRYPAFEDYVTRPEGVAHLPDDLFDDVADVPLFTHQLGPEDEPFLRSWSYRLAEAKNPTEVRDIWQAQIATSPIDHDRKDAAELAYIASSASPAAVERALLFPSLSASTQHSKWPAVLPAYVSSLRKHATQQQFWREQEDFEDYTSGWDQYSAAFAATHGRMPVIYDLFCGEGGFSRGARAAGCACYGFDVNSRCRARYESEPSLVEPRAADSGMIFVTADVISPEFWTELRKGTEGKYGHLPAPDIIHASPPCNVYSRLQHMRAPEAGETPTSRTDTTTIDHIMRNLRALEMHFQAVHQKPLIWQVENVPESEPYVRSHATAIARLCGTMMGHHVFKHRVFYCNYAATVELPHRHDGKLVGSRGVRGSAAFNDARYAKLPDPNMYGVYSKPYHARGTADEWHGAVGSPPGVYSTHGLAGVLPMGYGRLLCGQMLAHALNRSYGVPVVSPLSDDQVLQSALRRWTVTGCRPLSHYHFLGQVEPRQESEDPLGVFGLFPVTDDTSANQNADTTTADTGTADDDDSPYVMSRADQLKDPTLGPLISRYESDAAARKHLDRLWTVRGGLLFHRMPKSDGSLQPLLAVPECKRVALMRQYHYTNHRGHTPLVDLLRQSYYWPSMDTDCLDFTRTCEICGPRTSQPMQRVPTQPIPTPSRPFSVIHVDHKGPLSRSGPYTNILVVVCALTRFSLFIPVSSTTAEETLRTLVGRVFCVFGNAAAVVTDNGPAFISDLNKASSIFFGYRNIHVLPYNAQANGMAESAVKRIKLLLDRQTKGYTDWHKLLPIAQMLLNSTVHSGTGVTPHMALFGREPDGLEKLENPALWPDGDGHQFLRELRARLTHLHDELRQHSDALKRARADEDRARADARPNASRHGVIVASTPDTPRYAWLIHGSRDQATYLRKHGHGVPWRHKYKVLEVKPYAVRLEVPADGSVPRVREWQLIRRLSPAHPGEHGPDADSPVLTDSGIAIPRAHSAGAATPADPLQNQPEAEYEVECVSHAERVGNLYKIWLKWRNYDELTFRWRHELVRESANQELLREIDDAVAKERARLHAQHSSYAEDDAEDWSTPPQNDMPVEHASAPGPISNRLRSRGAPVLPLIADLADCPPQQRARCMCPCAARLGQQCHNAGRSAYGGLCANCVLWCPEPTYPDPNEACGCPCDGCNVVTPPRDALVLSLAADASDLDSTPDDFESDDHSPDPCIFDYHTALRGSMLFMDIVHY